MNFSELNVKEEIVTALKQQGIVEPTTIQSKTIPLANEGKDIIGISRTGSGKTASFGIPMLQKVVPRKGLQGLVLAPTRELANQISNELRKWGKNLDLKIATVFGGVSLDPQASAIARSEIVVGTPGRILDHLNRRNIDMTRMSMFVLDEADKMVEMGFIEDIEEIMRTMPKTRQILLFGATISNEIDYLKKKYMHNPVEAEAELHVKKDLLEQYYYNVPLHQKFSLLVHLLQKEDTDRVIIFCSKRSTVELVQNNLRANGIKSEMIHGKMSQNQRLRVIENFNHDKTKCLVASSVAARGLDIKGVTHVFNYDLSHDPQEYIHRVGRTARAGESGKAITLLSPPDFGNFDGIFRRYSVEIKELPDEVYPKLQFQTRVERPRDGGRRNGRSEGRPAGFRGRNRDFSRNDSERSSSFSSQGSSGFRGRSNNFQGNGRSGSDSPSSFRGRSNNNNSGSSNFSGRNSSGRTSNGNSRNYRRN